MVVREKFDAELKELQNKLLELGDFAKKAVDDSLRALNTHDIDLALKIMENDTKANLLFEEINDMSILLIAKQQPVAIDLRRIIACIKIATDLERIADFAVNIAKSTIRLGKERHIKTIEKLKKMYEITEKMLADVLIAFQDENIQMAKKVAEMDDEVDRLYGETIQELFQLHSQDTENVTQMIQMLFICRYLERTGDHITNIAEYVFYLVKGKHYDLNE